MTHLSLKKEILSTSVDFAVCIRSDLLASSLRAQGIEWNANIHLLKTTDLVGGDNGPKECIECWWGPQKTCSPDSNGTFSCCYSDSSCATLPDANTTQAVYYLSYTVCDVT